MKILHLGINYRKNGNVGDVAIHEAFKKMFGDNDVTFMKITKIYTQKDVDHINTHDAVVLAGGGILLHDTFPNKISDWQWAISPELINNIKIPLIVYAIGYNKIRGQRDFTEKFDKCMKALYNKSAYFSMRNRGSIKALEKHIGGCDIKLDPCPTMNKTLPNTGKKNVAFLLAGDRRNLRHPNIKQYLKQINIFVKYLNDHNIETICINHLVNKKDWWIFDYVPFDKLINMNGMDNNTVYEEYSKIDTVISDRGHGQMIPYACGCKIISPVSHDKNQWFLDDMGLSEYGIDESDSELGKKLIERYNTFS